MATTWSPTERALQGLARALVAQHTEIAISATPEDGRVQAQPVFCPMATTLLESLVDYTRAGQRRIDRWTAGPLDRWTAQHRCATMVFDDAQALFNANTLEELQRLQPR